MKCDKLSPSKIKTYSMKGGCEFKYYLQYIKKLDLGTNFGALNGSVCHVIYEEFAKAKIRGEKNPEISRRWKEVILGAYRPGMNYPDFLEGDEPPAEKEEIWKYSKKALSRVKECVSCEFFKNDKCFITNQDIEDFEGCPIEEYEQSIGLIKQVVEDNSYWNPLNGKIIDSENKFDFEIDCFGDMVPINGIIDLTTEIDESTLEIHDYKTGNYIQSYNDCTKDPQLLIYHLAARTIHSSYDNVFVNIYYLKRASGPMHFAFTKKDEETTKKGLKHYWNHIKENVSPQRRCDMPSGRVYFDHVCKNLCDIDTCKAEWKKFNQEQGGIILPEEE